MSDKVNAFDILKEMGINNLDIRGFNIYNNVVDIRLVGKGQNEYGKITLTIDPGTASILLRDIASNNHSFIGMLVIADKSQYETTKKSLEKIGND